MQLLSLGFFIYKMGVPTITLSLPEDEMGVCRAPGQCNGRHY